MIGAGLHRPVMILGYPSVPSVPSGDTLFFHVSTDAPEFRIEIHRQGASLERMGVSTWIPGERFPALAPYDDWSKVWRGHAVRIPADWPSGAYVAMFVEGDGHGHVRAIQRLDRRDPDGRCGKALFVVRSAVPASPILYKIPLFTYAAYNAEGDPRGSLYTWPARKVTLHRPGNGTGGTPWDADVVDAYDLDSPRQTFAHWDAKFIRWLEENGYSADYATDLDIHQNPGDFLSRYRLLLSVGHDEYWSDAMRDHVEAFIARGGNVAFFSGNVSYWRATLSDEDTALEVDKRVHPGDDGSRDRFSRTRPENVMTGVSYRSAGGQWNAKRPSGGGYTVVRPDHWIFAGTGLARDAVFGEAAALVGYECDGAVFAQGARGLPVTTGADCSPLDFEILATASVADWEGANAGARSAATMGLYTHRGTVFTAATTDWARVLAEGDAAVDRITRNVLDALPGRSVTLSGPYPTHCGRAVAVEGEAGTFHADIRDLPLDREIRYQWSVSGGTPGPLDGPTLALTMPSPPVAVAVSLRIDVEGDPRAAFGTLTVEPYSRRELAWFEVLCELARLRGQARSADRAPLGAGEGARCLTAELYDPLDPTLPFFARPEAPPPPPVLRAMMKSAARLVELTRHLLEEP
ncbi:Hypothetical protein A7982_01493 [Minicystis rosea]|nr:Hypothetical protein A7982_01493 [Minicystis rosea]